MSNYQALNDKIHKLTGTIRKLNNTDAKVDVLCDASEVINELLTILGADDNDLNHGEDALENIFSPRNFRNTKIETWFSYHPIYTDERVTIQYFENNLCEVKFYWLNDNSTKARITAGVMLTPNWEDSETTEDAKHRVGIDFFLKKDISALLMVISYRGNLRVMEFSNRLTNTQVEILDKISGAFKAGSKKDFHRTLWDSMALSEVNKKFYEGIAKRFAILVQHLTAFGKNEDDAKSFSNRLIGRLMFIWFLRKKGIVANENLYFPPEIDDSTNYYDKTLKSLFFKTFNTPIFKRTNGDKKTPYLNGGLFESHDNDWVNETINFPDNYFNDLFDHLDKYNFTTDESSPEYELIAIDPEMLGKVFESLLAEQRTEPGAQARKAKGAFYTPREIVSYMCKESLRLYLYTAFEDKKYRESVDRLLDTPDYDWEKDHSNSRRDISKYISKFDEMLKSYKVIDPACGSGAFPMGMLQLLTKTFMRLDPQRDQYEVKMGIIKNNIFGVDIEPMAVEISKLRAWLAIVVDDNDKIDPLPNLDFKFICADSLIPLVVDAYFLNDDPLLEDKLSKIRDVFFEATDPETKEKCKEKYYSLTNNQRGVLFGDRDSQYKSFDPFKNNAPANFFNAEYMFGINKFDAVIGNPPYIGEKNHKDLFAKHKKTSFGEKYYKGKMDFFYFFFHLALDNLVENGCCSLITTNYYPTADGALKLREDFYNRANIVKLVNFNEYKIFESALGQHNLITILRKSDSPDPNFMTEQVFVEIDGGPDGRELNAILSGQSSDVSYGETSKSQLYDAGPNKYILFHKKSTSVDIDILLDKIKNIGKPLSHFCFVNQGVVPGAMTMTEDKIKKYPQINAKKGDPILVFSKGTFSEIVGTNDLSDLKPFYKNSDIFHYITKKECDKELLYLDGSKKPNAKILNYLENFKPILQSRRECKSGVRSWYALQWPREKKIFEGPKIVVPYRCQANNFAYNDDSFYGSTDMYFITPIQESLQSINFLKALTAILNSKLIFVWLISRGKTKGNVLELFPTPLNEIPIVDFDIHIQLQLARLVDEIIATKSGDENADITKQEMEIDSLVYKIYGLSDSEIAKIEKYEL